MKREKLVLLSSSLTLNVTEEEEEKGISLFFINERKFYPFSLSMDERYDIVTPLPEGYCLFFLSVKRRRRVRDFFSSSSSSSLYSTTVDVVE